MAFCSISVRGLYAVLLLKAKFTKSSGRTLQNILYIFVKGLISQGGNGILNAVIHCDHIFTRFENERSCYFEKA